MSYPLGHFDDIDLITVFADLLERALAAKGITDTPVVQLNQPTQQPRGTSSVYFNFMFDKRFGWPQTSMLYDEVKKEFVFTERQHFIGTVQVSALYPATPGDMARITAKDLINYLAQKMNSMNYVRAFRKAGLGILRIPHINQSPFDNDRGQYEFMPSFDMDICFNREIGDTVPPIVEILGELDRV